MLPAELQAKYANNPYFQQYQAWNAAGGKHPFWEYEAEAAAQAAGLSRFVGIEDAYVDDPTRFRMAPDPLDWGEQKKFSIATGAEISRNPAWIRFVQNWNPASPPPAAAPFTSGQFGNVNEAARATAARPAVVNQLAPGLGQASQPVTLRPPTLGSELSKRLAQWRGGGGRGW